MPRLSYFYLAPKVKLILDSQDSFYNINIIIWTKDPIEFKTRGAKTFNNRPSFTFCWRSKTPVGLIIEMIWKIEGKKSGK
jgi:hypothetical protein